MSTPLLEVGLAGRVRGQGSLKLIRGVHGNEVATYDAAVRNYRNLLVQEMRTSWSPVLVKGLVQPVRKPHRGPVGVSIVIDYPRPAAHYLPVNGKRREPELRPDAPLWHVGTPDCDKVARLVNDALVAAGVLMDDKQIVALQVRDQWGEGAGMLSVTVWELS